MKDKRHKESNLFEQTKKICQKYNIKPVHSRGQNFLINEEVYSKIIKAANLNKNDIVLEVGPGLGFLTEMLAYRAKKVIAVELDKKLAKVLDIRLKEQCIKNVEIINQNILDIKFQTPNIKYKIVANLPYNITSIFLRKFLSSQIKPDLMVLMLQKEVAQRIVAGPSKMSLLSVSSQFYSSPKIIEIIESNNFWPAPKIASAIIKLRSHNNFTSKISKSKEKEFFRFVKIGFSARRKMLKNNLAAGLRISQNIVEDKIKKAEFNTKIRAQDLSINDWIILFGIFFRNML